MSFSFLARSTTPQTSEETLNIWTYELAKVLECFYSSGAMASVHFAHTELADVSAMARLFCEQQGLDFPLDHISSAASISQVFSSSQEGVTRLFITLGRVTQRYHYTKRFGENSSKGAVKDAIGEFVALLYHFCRYNHWEFWELLELGEVRYLERMRDLRERGKNEQLKEEFRRSV